MCKECAEVPSSEGANGLWQILKELSFKTLLPHVVDIFFLFVELHLFYSDLTSLYPWKSYKIVNYNIVFQHNNPCIIQYKIKLYAILFACDVPGLPMCGLACCWRPGSPKPTNYNFFGAPRLTLERATRRDSNSNFG